MRTRARTTTAAALAALALTLTACSADDSGDSKTADSPKSQEPGISAEDMAKAREAAGLPPKPDAATAAAFIKALNAIDLDIVHGKNDKALSRGSDTCLIIKNHPKRPEQIDQTNKRWSSPTHPEGHGLTTAEKILDATHKHLCPDF